MERKSTIEEAKALFGKNFIGKKELHNITNEFNLHLAEKTPDIPYSITELEKSAKDYILILGAEKMNDGKALNLLLLREKFGVDSRNEPCFYNQDWYLKEDFMHQTIENKWYLINKNVSEDSRAVQPNILNKIYNFPSAILCAYVFFAYWFTNKEILWSTDFVWCNNLDHNGDKIYVGKYIDIDGVNNNGFSIHRHLNLRNCYGAVNLK